MRIQTSKGKQYAVEWIDGPTGITGQLMLEMKDNRRIQEIAAEFEGLERIERYSEHEGNKAWEGYTTLAGITRQPGGHVLIQLAREE